MVDDIKEQEDLRRSFKGPGDDDIEYFIVAPTAEDIRGADWQYSKTYTNSLVEGITTSAEMMDILMRRGIIGPEFEQRARELALILNDKITALEEEADLDTKRDLSIEVAIAREELFQWNQRLNGPMSNTCEQIADDSRLEYLTSSIVQTKDSTRVWENFDGYKTEKDQELATRARFETMLFLQGFDSDFIEQTPEAKAMREVEEDVLAKAREAIEVAKAMAEEEAKKKEKAASIKVPKKKAAAKKKPVKKTAKK
jgi:hypothetical protein